MGRLGVHETFILITPTYLGRLQPDCDSVQFIRFDPVFRYIPLNFSKIPNRWSQRERYGEYLQPAFLHQTRRYMPSTFPRNGRIGVGWRERESYTRGRAETRPIIAHTHSSFSHISLHNDERVKETEILSLRIVQCTLF